MSISQSRYVDIQTRATPAEVVNRKELIARFFTSSPTLSTSEIADFTNADAVKTRFGDQSNEYKIARKYFGYVSKTNVRPTKISFAEFHKVATDAFMQGVGHATLAEFQAINAGTFNLTLNAVTATVQNIDLTQAASFADVAATVQTAIRLVQGWGTAIVTYVPNLGFKLELGAPGAAVIGYATDDPQGEIAGDLGWTEASNPQLSNGIAAETPLEAFQRVIDVNNNFGSFAYIDALTTAEITAVAQYNHDLNVQYMYSVSVNSVNYVAIQAAVANFDGVALTYNDNDNEYAYFMPMAIMAATNYDAPNGVVNYMFTQFNNETPAVYTDTQANVLDAIKVNYYGQTQSTGKNISFYQRGYLQGSVTDMGVYSNEIWLKSAMSALALSLFLERNQIPANKAGIGVLRSAMQSVINEAITNGTISAEKELTQDQKVVINQLTNDNDAWREIQQNGYWINVEIVQVTVLGVQEYHLKYTLIYGKGDSIRKITGLDVLI